MRNVILDSTVFGGKLLVTASVHEAFPGTDRPHAMVTEEVSLDKLLVMFRKQPDEREGVAVVALRVAGMAGDVCCNLCAGIEEEQETAK